MTFPVLFEGDVKAVVEPGSTARFGTAHNDCLRVRSRTLTTQLQDQMANKLMKSNDRLQRKARSQSKSEGVLLRQRRELQQTNKELQEKARQLSEQVRQIEYKSAEVEIAKTAYQQKAEQLAQSSRYKSQFLANMSHELRTPLNSLLILSQLLAENGGGNLTRKQVDYAKTIFASGNQLLALISDILDLAKIESGTIAINVEPAGLLELRNDIEQAFRPIAIDKGLTFEIRMGNDLPVSIRTDVKRLRQILHNLLSNAFKFTPAGNLGLQVERAQFGWTPGHAVLDVVDEVIAFSVVDSGIGIPREKQKIIFEAFQQADGSTSRRFGGTGLGLAISNELAELLSGEIEVRSNPGAGSTFTLYLPVDAGLVRQPEWREAGAPEAGGERHVAQTGEALDQGVADDDDRDEVRPGDDLALIVGGARRFATRMRVLAREAGLKALVAGDTEMAITLARRFASHAIALCMDAGGVADWTIVDRMRRERHQPGIPMSFACIDPLNSRHLLVAGVVVPNGPLQASIADAQSSAVWQSVTAGGPRAFLVFEADPRIRREMMDAISFGSARVAAVSSGPRAVKYLAINKTDCIVMRKDPRAALKLLRDLCAAGRTGHVGALLQCADDIPGNATELMILRQAASPDVLMRETALSLHRARVDFTTAAASARVDLAATSLSGRRVLVIDDDMRNIFAMTSALEHYGMVVANAESGPAGIEVLNRDVRIDIVLLDMMLPGVDGYQTMRMIRNIDRFRSLPIIAVTARAMKEDRGKCLEAGASEYAAKPVVMSDLLSKMRLLLDAGDRQRPAGEA